MVDLNHPNNGTREVRVLVNTNKLKGAMKEADYTQEKLASELNMAINTLNAKINGRSPISTDEAIEMCRILKIEACERKVEIFLN